jgi:hypothetical protein
MAVYLRKQLLNGASNITPSHGTVLRLAREVEGDGHKLFMDNYVSLPQMFSELYNRKINCCGTICHNRQGMSETLGQKILKLKRSYNVYKVKEGTSAVC